MRATVISILAALSVLVAASSAAAPRPKVSISAVASADSVHVIGTWTSVKDARGGAVMYRFTFQAGTTVAAEGITPDTSITRTFSRPLAGDTVVYSLRVVAVDSRGKESPEAWSRPLPVITPWTPPAPPTVSIDTLLASGPPDPTRYPWNYDSLSAYLLGGTRVGNADLGEQPIEFSYIGQVAEVCYLAWYGPLPEVPRFQIQGSTNDPETLRVETVPRRSDCLAVTALRPTTLPVSGDAQAYRAALKLAGP